MKSLMIYLGVFVILGLVAYGGYQIQRAWNYSWGYESKVQWTICDMVKPEALKEPEKCDD